MKQNNRALLMLTASMTIFGTIGIFRKYIHLPSSLLAMARGLIGTLFLIVFLALRRRKFDREAIRRNGLLLVLSGIFIGFNWILLFEAYRYTTIATATLCYYMAPVLVILFAPLVIRERLTAQKLVSVLLALCGMALVSGIFGGTSDHSTNTVGILLGLGAAALYASVILVNKKLREIDGIDRTVIQLFSAGAVMIPYVLLAEDLSAIVFDPRSLIFLLIVAIVHTGIAYAMYFGSIGSLSAHTVAIFSYIDPVVAIVLSAVVFGERMGIDGIIGAILILGAALLGELPIWKIKGKK